MLQSDWGRHAEGPWAVRQIAAALASAADVHVVTQGGRVPSVRREGPFVVHELATTPAVRELLLRDTIVSALSSGSSDGSAIPASPEWLDDVASISRAAPAALDAFLDTGLIEPWRPALEILYTLAPDHVVVADYRDLGAVMAIDDVLPAVPVTLVPCGTERPDLLPRFEPVVDRASSVLTFTETERRAFSGLSDHVHRLDFPSHVDPDLGAEPLIPLQGESYVAVLTADRADTESGTSQLARLLRLRFPQTAVAILARDRLDIFKGGRQHSFAPPAGTRDVARFLAAAVVTVDLAPGPLFAGRCLESLLYGTPIVVPAGTRAQEHADGGGGLSFENAGELVWCVEAMFDPSTRDQFSAQGRTYALAHSVSDEVFIDRVLAAIDAGAWVSEAR